MRRATFAALAVFSGLTVLSACGRKETPSGSAPPGPESTDPVAVEPSGSPARLKPGLKLTTFPNNKFAGPGETKGEASTLGFPCDQNPYNGMEVSFRYEGYLKVEQEGTYVFQILSDDQSSMKLNSVLIIDQPRSPEMKEGSAKLKVGTYLLTLDYQNNVGPACLVVKWSTDDGGTFSEIPASQIFHD